MKRQQLPHPYGKLFIIKESSFSTYRTIYLSHTQKIKIKKKLEVGGEANKSYGNKKADKHFAQSLFFLIYFFLNIIFFSRAPPKKNKDWKFKKKKKNILVCDLYFVAWMLPYIFPIKTTKKEKQQRIHPTECYRIPILFVPHPFSYPRQETKNNFISYRRSIRSRGCREGKRASHVKTSTTSVFLGWEGIVCYFVCCGFLFFQLKREMDFNRKSG